MEKDDIKGINFPTEKDIARLEKDNALRVEWGKKIQQLRLERYISKRQLAEMVGTHAHHIQRIEEGKYSVKFDLIVAIFDALGYQLEIVPKK